MNGHGILCTELYIYALLFRNLNRCFNPFIKCIKIKQAADNRDISAVTLIRFCK